MGGTLAGLRVLDDEAAFLTAELLERVLAECGCTVLGPVSSVERALALIAREPPNVALLDIELGGRSAAPIAAALRARGVPFLLVTGYDVPDEPALRPEPCLKKPFKIERLVEALAQIVRAGEGTERDPGAPRSRRSAADGG